MEENTNKMSENLASSTDRIPKLVVESRRLPDGVTMKDGKMMKIKDGEMTMMETDITIINETKIMIDGTILKRDGYKMMLKEGQHIEF